MMNRLKRNGLKVGLLCMACALCGMLPGCGGGVDTSADFAMIHNGNPYNIALTDTAGYIREMDVGYSETYQFTVMFPAKALNRMGAKGFELRFEPNEITLGQVIRINALKKNHHFQLEFFPLVGHNLNEGLMLAYSSAYLDGSLEVRFDVLEPKRGGRVKGEIIHAVLNGFFESQDSMDTIKPKTPQKLEIFNFPFDTQFKQSRF